ncbi:MAG: DMT family transporter [Candidatus Dormibacteraceae bacterium]
MNIAARTRPAAARGFERRFNSLSVIFIGVAATLWATDAYFRNQLVQHLSPTEIVLLEDGLITLCLLPVLVIRRRELANLDRRGWLATIAIAFGAQSLATVMFTASFAYRNFAETYVLQQTQPLIAVALAGVVLGERRRPLFWPVLVLAVASVYMVIFASNPTQPVAALQHGRLPAALLALGAAALWAAGTVLGRMVLARVSFPTMTALRVTLALPLLLAIVMVGEGPAGLTHYRPGDLPDFVGIALIPGLFALLLYYRALASTPASISTIAELAYPVAATLIASAPAPWGFAQPLYPVQVVGTVLLIAAIGFFNWANLTGHAVAGRRRLTPRPLPD